MSSYNSNNNFTTSTTTTENGERVFYDTARRHHKTDGVIFQPDAAYVVSRNYALLKWKWPDLRSIDLQVRLIETVTNSCGVELHLLCSGPDNTLIDCTQRGSDNVSVGDHDLRRLLADASMHADPIIVEVAYDAEHGLWRYLQIRRDKTSPNYIDSVLGVFLEQAEAITVEELQCQLLAAAKGVKSGFDEHLQAARLAALAHLNQQYVGAASNAKS